MVKLPQDKILIATRNRHKFREMQEILKDLPYTLVSLDDMGIKQDVEEDRNTFYGNALKKAEFYAQFGITALADDSGLCVYALNDRPGVMSARYGGSGLKDADRRKLVIDEVKRVLPTMRNPDMEARFECSIALVIPGSATHIFHGDCTGELLLEERGSNGFGYDPIFLDPTSGLTFAEMSAEDKHLISHRGRAFRKLLFFLERGRERTRVKSREVEKVNKMERDFFVRVGWEPNPAIIQQSSKHPTTIHCNKVEKNMPIADAYIVSQLLLEACKIAMKNEPHWQKRVQAAVDKKKEDYRVTKMARVEMAREAVRMMSEEDKQSILESHMLRRLWNEDGPLNEGLTLERLIELARVRAYKDSWHEMEKKSVENKID